jgi:hypothetical protein
LNAQFEFTSEPENINIETKMEPNRNITAPEFHIADEVAARMDKLMAKLETTLAQLTNLTTPIPANTNIVKITPIGKRALPPTDKPTTTKRMKLTKNDSSHIGPKPKDCMIPSRPKRAVTITRTQLLQIQIQTQVDRLRRVDVVRSPTLPPNAHCAAIREEFNTHKLQFYKYKPGCTFLEFISRNEHLSDARLKVMNKMYFTSLITK